MTKGELKELIKQVYSEKVKVTDTEEIIDVGVDVEAEEEEEIFTLLTNFPPLKEIIVSLLTDQYGLFIEDIQWVAPRPSTFRIILKNKYIFYLVYDRKSWVAQIEGKKYYLLDLADEEYAAEAIARLLRYGTHPGAETAEFEETETETVETGGEEVPSPPEEMETEETEETETEETT